MEIRTATHLDSDAIRRIHLAAFGEEERENVSELAINLLNEETTPPIISLVAEIDGKVIGHVAFSPVKIGGSDDDTPQRGYILAPLAVDPEFQKQGVGSKLIEAGRQRLTQQQRQQGGIHLVFVYGDPNYYGRFGFSADSATQYSPPYTLRYPFGWQALILNNNQTRINRPDEELSAVTIGCVSSLSDPKFW